MTRLAAVACFLLIGCSSTHVAPVPERLGWSWQEVGAGRFRIQIAEEKDRKSNEALAYAALVAASRGYRSFNVVEEDGKGESGTFFMWHDGYDPRHGIPSFEPGSFFEIICRRDRPKGHSKWFDVSLLLNQPNQLPKPTAPSGRGSS